MLSRLTLPLPHLRPLLSPSFSTLRPPPPSTPPLTKSQKSIRSKNAYASRDGAATRHLKKSLNAASYFDNAFVTSKKLNVQLLNHFKKDSYLGVTNVVVNNSGKFNSVNWTTAVDVVRKLVVSHRWNALSDMGQVDSVLDLLVDRLGSDVKAFGHGNLLAVIKNLASKEMRTLEVDELGGGGRTRKQAVEVLRLAGTEGKWLVKKATPVQLVALLATTASVSNPPSNIIAALTSPLVLSHATKNFLASRDTSNLLSLQTSLTSLDMSVDAVDDAVAVALTYIDVTKATRELGTARDVNGLLDVFVHGRRIFDFELYSEWVFALGKSPDYVMEYKEDERMRLVVEDLAIQIEVVKNRRDPPKGGTPKRIMNFVEGCERVGVSCKEVVYWINSRAGWWAREASDNEKERVKTYVKEKGMIVKRLEDEIAKR